MANKSSYDYKTLKDEDLAKCLPCPFCGEFNEEKQNFLHRTIDKQGWYSIGCSGCAVSLDSVYAVKKKQSGYGTHA